MNITEIKKTIKTQITKINWWLKKDKLSWERYDIELRRNMGFWWLILCHHNEKKISKIIKYY